MWLTNKSQSKQKAITYPSEVIDFPYSHTERCNVRNLCLQPASGNPDSRGLKLKGIINCSRTAHRQEHSWEWDTQETHVDRRNPIKRTINERGHQANSSAAFTLQKWATASESNGQRAMWSNVWRSDNLNPGALILWGYIQQRKEDSFCPVKIIEENLILKVF